MTKCIMTVETLGGQDFARRVGARRGRVRRDGGHAELPGVVERGGQDLPGHRGVWPASYLAFISKIDMALATQAIQFDSLTLQCASDQVAGFGDLIANFGIKVYLTDECAGNL